MKNRLLLFLSIFFSLVAASSAQTPITNGIPYVGDNDHTLNGKIAFNTYVASQASGGGGGAGSATAANQVTGNASLASIDGKLPALSGGAVPVVNATGATAAKQDTGNTSLASIDSKTPALSGGAVPVTASTLPLPTGAAKAAGAANVNVAQVTATTSAGTLAIARSTRRSILIKNTDASITVYVGPATVTSGNGIPLKAGESFAPTWVGLIQVISASGSPVVAIFDEYD